MRDMSNEAIATFFNFQDAKFDLFNSTSLSSVCAMEKADLFKTISKIGNFVFTERNRIPCEIEKLHKL